MFTATLVALGLSGMEIPRNQLSQVPFISPIEDALIRNAKMVLENGPQRIAMYQGIILRYICDPTRQDQVQKYQKYIQKQQEEIDRAKKVLGKN